MKFAIRFIIVLCLYFVSLFASAQKLKKEMGNEDVAAALKMIGIEFFEFDFKEVKENYSLHIYVDEYEKDSILLTKNYNFGQWKSSAEPKTFKLLSKIESDTASMYVFNILCPNMEISIPFKVLPRFRKVHYWQPIKEGTIEYNKKIPLLFLGMAWEAEFQGMKIKRFCWGEEIGRELDNESMDKVVHKFVISYKLIEKARE